VQVVELAQAVERLAQQGQHALQRLVPELRRQRVQQVAQPLGPLAQAVQLLGRGGGDLARAAPHALPQRL